MQKMTKAWMFALLVVAACKGGGGGGSAIGIQECDDYVAKIEACTTKMGAQGDGVKRQTKMIAKDWKEQAKDASMKGELAKTCTEAAANAKKAYTDCAF